MMCWLAAVTFIVLTSCAGKGSSSSAEPEKPKPTMDEKALFLVGAVPLVPGTCIANADPSATLVAQGVLDLAFTTSYSAFLLVGNQLLRADAGSETEGVALRSAEITLTTADGTVLQTYSSVGTGFIASTTSSAGYAAMSVNVIPSAVGTSAAVRNAQLLSAKIRVLGEAQNGTQLISTELDFPIRVCTGCLLQYPPEAADPTQPPGSNYLCSTAPSTSTRAEPPQPCIIGQDLPFPCTLCAATVQICRDPSLNPSVSN